MRADKMLVFNRGHDIVVKRDLTDVEEFWLTDKSKEWDITIGEDSDGDPYVSIAIKPNCDIEIKETTPSWKGKIIKLIRNPSQPKSAA